MALPKFEKDIGYVSKLDDYPNDVGGMSSEELKATFDRAGQEIQDYINKLLIPQIESDVEAAAQGVSGGNGIDGATLRDNSVPDEKIIGMDGAKIKNGSLGTEKHKKGSITRELLSEDARTLQTEDFPNKVVPNRALDDYAVSEMKVADSAITERKIASNAVSEEFNRALLEAAWIEADGYWHQSVSTQLSGEVYRVIADVALSGFATEQERKQADEEWGKIYYATFDAAGGKFYAREKPEMDLPIKVIVIKK